MQSHFLKQRGITLIEVLISVSIIATIVIVVAFSINTYVDARTQLLSNVKSTYLAEEGYEILRALRDDDWSDMDALVIGDTNYLDVSTTTIAFTSTPEIIDTEYTRSFILTEVYRDTNDDIGDIGSVGATIDTEILEVTVSVLGPNGTTSLTALLSNVHII